MPLISTTTVGTATIKSIASGGIGTALALLLGDTESMSLLAIGLISSLFSFFYDWVHTHPRIFGLAQVSCIMKYVLYGVSLMFVAFYLGVNQGSEYLCELPKTAWGLVAAMIAGSAVSIVDWFIPKIQIVIDKLFARIK